MIILAKESITVCVLSLFAPVPTPQWILTGPWTEERIKRLVETWNESCRQIVLNDSKSKSDAINIYQDVKSYLILWHLEMFRYTRHWMKIYFIHKSYQNSTFCWFLFQIIFVPSHRSMLYINFINIINNNEFCSIFSINMFYNFESILYNTISFISKSGACKEQWKFT